MRAGRFSNMALYNVNARPRAILRESKAHSSTFFGRPPPRLRGFVSLLPFGRPLPGLRGALSLEPFGRPRLPVPPLTATAVTVMVPLVVLVMTQR